MGNNGASPIRIPENRPALQYTSEGWLPVIATICQRKDRTMAVVINEGWDAQSLLLQVGLGLRMTELAEAS